MATRETGWRPEPAYAGRVLRCPWHGLEIDLATGASIGNPRWRCRVYETRVNADGIVEVVL